MTSYITDGTVGPWAREKLEYLQKYLQAYTTVLKNQSNWCKGYLYIDAFAGAGKAPERQYHNHITNSESLFPDISDYITEQEVQASVYTWVNIQCK